MKRGYTLVVEDDLEELETILKALAERPLPGDVVVASDGGEALHALYGATRLGHPDLLIVDADAPKVRELQLPVLARAHPVTANLPIVTIVGSVHDLWRERDGRLISDWFVRKPCGVLALGAAITAAQAHRYGRVAAFATGAELHR